MIEEATAPDPVTDADLDSWEKLCAEAAPGPWRWRRWNEPSGEFATPNRRRKSGWSDSVGDHYALLLQGKSPYANPDCHDAHILGIPWPSRRVSLIITGLGHEEEAFIAESRMIIPRLLAEVRRLRKSVE
jgi:hypothetical protein